MQEKKLLIASDHAGCPMKQKVVNYLTSKGYVVIDYGTDKPEIAVDYPDKAYLVAKGLYQKEAPMGVLICGSGIGMSMAVNRYSHVRGALVYTPEMAELSRKHNNANVLILGGRFTNEETVYQILDCFLNTSFEGGRHEARVKKLENMPYDF